MLCKTCGTPFEPKPWPTTKHIYCSVACIKRAWYERNKARVNAQAKQWCRDNPEKRLEVQQRWNAKAATKAYKRAWQKAHYAEWYARIKAEGGMTFAQEPSSAKFDGMPRSAIAAGVVDFILPPAEIARQVIKDPIKSVYFHVGPAQKACHMRSTAGFPATG